MLNTCLLLFYAHCTCLADDNDRALHCGDCTVQFYRRRGMIETVPSIVVYSQREQGTAGAFCYLQLTIPKSQDKKFWIKLIYRFSKRYWLLLLHLSTIKVSQIKFYFNQWNCPRTDFSLLYFIAFFLSLTIIWACIQKSRLFKFYK